MKKAAFGPPFLFVLNRLQSSPKNRVEGQSHDFQDFGY
jgi:hypothetical protein